jgi:hypothetical protein|tara:strand:- start:645 stop:770 length:126 start_codon:yes stop_codon:yes gene_type:complete
VAETAMIEAFESGFDTLELMFLVKAGLIEAGGANGCLAAQA